MPALLLVALIQRARGRGELLEPGGLRGAVLMARYNRRDLFRHWIRREEPVNRPRERACCRHRAMCDAGAGLGLRQGEIFDPSLDEVDFLRRVVHVWHQVRLCRHVKPVFGPPKGGKEREMPLLAEVAAALAPADQDGLSGSSA